MMVSFSMLTIAANDKKKKNITPTAAPERTVLVNSKVYTPKLYSHFIPHTGPRMVNSSESGQYLL